MPIHPTALIDPTAEIDAGAEIGPYCIVGAEVHIGARTRLMANNYVEGATWIGEDNLFLPSRTANTRAGAQRPAPATATASANSSPFIAARKAADWSPRSAATTCSWPTPT